jgi:HK97 family phage portal protein|tara:strand:+ start:12 stop:1433 length:1422 start_codon:yes stop_codon:yes gene_type:complete
MGIIDTIKEKVGLTQSQPVTKKEVRLFTSQNTTTPANMPFLHTWFWTARLGMPRKANISELRQYGKSIWVQMVFTAIKKQIMIADWNIVPTDKEDETDYDSDIEAIKSLLMYPNRNKDTFGDLWSRYLHDLLEIDAGVMYKGKKSGKLVELYTYDASRFLFDMDDHGIVNGYYQYSYKFPKNKPLFFEKQEIIYGKMGHNNEHFPYGWSPLQSITQEIEVMIQATRYNKEFFQNNAVPDVFVNIKMEQDELERFKTYWDQQVKGKPHKMAFTNAEDIDIKPLSLNNKDMEWLAGQEWYHHAIFAAYGLSPQEVGYYDKSSRATGESQERITIKNAIKPYLTHIEDKINREIIPDIIGHDKVKFEWFTKDDAAEKIEHDQVMAKLNANVYTINEVRAREGLNPVEWGDQPMMMVMQQANAELNGDNDDKDKDTSRDSKRDNPKDKDKNSKGEDKVKDREAEKEYAERLAKQLEI